MFLRPNRAHVGVPFRAENTSLPAGGKRVDLKVLLTGNRRWCRCPPRRWAPRRVAWYRLRLRSLDLVVCYQPFRGFHLRSVVKRGGPLVDRLYVFAPPEFSMKKVQPGKQGSEGGPHHLAAIEATALTSFPNLVAHACILRYEDGTPRRAGWWTVGTSGAAWTITIKDPDSCCQIRVNSQTLDDALALADLLLGSEEAPWEADPWAQQQAKKRNKAS